jgi:hypothetical protein
MSCFPLVNWQTFASVLHGWRRGRRVSDGRSFNRIQDMNITSVSSPVTTSTGSALQPTSVAVTSDQDADGSSNSTVHHRHGGGHMFSAVAQALQSLGLTLPSNGTSGSPAASSDSTDATATSASKVKQDLQQFMHQLFEAVKSQDSAAASSTSSGPSAPGGSQSGFGAGLASLITQVSAGTAPADLQSAFAQLSSDLPASAASSSAAAGATDSQVTLQAFLTNLQQDLGYGQASASASASGSLVATQV